VELDIGRLPDADQVTQGDSDDPERIAKVTARIVARSGDKLGFIRNISRHFEGEDRRAGILSDLLSAAWLLYKRNPDAFETAVKQGAQLLREQQAARKTKTSTTGKKTTNGGNI
jgi:hypothetical protein